MFAKIPIALALIFSLLFSAEVFPVTPPVVKAEPGDCVGMACLKGCCTSKACCASAQQQDNQKPPTPAAPRPELQVATLDFQIFALLYAASAEARIFIQTDEKSGGHVLPPLMVNCIQLI